MNSPGLIPSASADRLREALVRSKHSLWFGALSFEERCITSLKQLQDHGLQIGRGVALQYPSDVHPAAEDKLRRERNWTAMQGFAAKVFSDGLYLTPSQPYSFQIAQDDFRYAVAESKADLVLIDITCLTKIHTLAIASALSHSEKAIAWAVTYTIPENYSALADVKRIRGWRDIIVAPLAETARFFNETHSRGLIFPGHEADRLIVALAEVEPSGGMIIIAEAPKRPDLEYLAELNNRKVLRRLTRLRYGEWKQCHLNLLSLDNLTQIIAPEIGLARQYDSPVTLFPFGPKPVVFFSALQLAEDYPEGSWFVYPIPSGYDVNYSEGVEASVWFFGNSSPKHEPVTNPASQLSLGAGF